MYVDALGFLVTVTITQALVGLAPLLNVRPKTLVGLLLPPPPILERVVVPEIA